MRRKRRAEPVRSEQLEVSGETVLVIRKRIANVYLRVKPPDGHLEVTAPLKLDDDQIRAFIDGKRRWIATTRERLARSRDVYAQPGADGQLQSGRSEAEAKRILHERLPTLLDRWVPVVGRRPERISLRKMKTRWGSCTPATASIRLNTDLAWLDPDLLEYVLVHELTHLYEHGHGPGFRARMDRYMPDWTERRRRLSRYLAL
ncbi:MULTISPECIES: M48 family metallopeptidase [Bifidobacterium]|uniref:M48 family metallopeptidase n=1 Tax=Bifidobacterium TaxID=1678 RepID=UPI0018DDF560|nr:MULTISPECIES: SprT family zinc-dependent metalloprotease [Bifidobacterium]MBH9981043.1 M48 family metallopeptidase [Bifidobacterium asteroides]MBI0100213.1 M48 family metallopeptidase [Bifidobacterium sp. W8114]